MNEDVVILICRVNNRNRCWGNWGNSSWNCDNRDDRHDHDNIVVDSSSDPRIRRGSDCAEAIRRLLNAGYRLINTDAIEDCGIKIVYTFIRYRPRPRREEAVSPETFASC
jgi:Aldo/keto reductases, related to diketogulonate reductase